MRKSVLFGGSILCLFILVSLSYQPMVADTPIEEIKETKAPNIDIDKLRELYNKLDEWQSNDGCCLPTKDDWYPIIICSILFVLLGNVLKIGILFQLIASLGYYIDSSFLSYIGWQIVEKVVFIGAVMLFNMDELGCIDLDFPPNP